MFLVHALALISLSKIAYTGSGSHSLWYLLTLTSGQSPFPELSVLKMLDDFPVGYYDSTVKRLMLWNNWQKEEDKVQQAEFKQHILEVTKNMMKRRLQLLRKHYNHSGGLLTYQRLAGCELDADGTERFKSIDAYNGEDVFEFVSNSESWYSFNPKIEEEFTLMESGYAYFSQYFFKPLCISTMKKHLQRLNTLLNRKVHPRVRVIHKQDRDSGGMEVTCLATGFYPRHINMTLQRNSQPVPDQELTRGEPLPNGDGTYQLRRSLSVSAAELRERHLYTCTVTHSSVDNKLDVSWEFQPSRDNVVHLGISFGVLTALVLTMFGLCIWMKRDTVFRKALQSVSAVGGQNEESSCASEPLQTETEVSEVTEKF
ncbi:hypothetical protein MATL_G00226470 [Megalops atlanticus]|uniref:Ig-like domain-containing protein n=1 Tax=Megalops atlanticus TaxID=7932 RepID=A0A9D3SWN5_MEGAT|nr:hypothetical protein MATL_G00226470 [Megalops atlanticus]